MFVSESNIFDPGNIKIKVSSMDGTDVLLDVNPEITVDHLKVQIASHLYDPVESVKTSLYHRVLHVRSGRVLQEDRSLNQSGVRDNDELLLIKKRVPGPSLEGAESRIREDSKKTPTADEIKQVTEGLARLNVDKPKKETVPSTNFKDELRKILVSLIDAAQKILCLNPEAAKIFEEAEKCLTEEKSLLSTEPEIDTEALEQITAMGFPSNQARRALLLNHMSSASAIQWLLEHDGDTDTEDDVPSATGGITPVIAAMVTSQEPSTPEYKAEEQVTDTTADAAESEALRLARMQGPDKVKKMLQGFRTYRRREFKPSTKALRTLVEMGFDESDALDALCIHGNRQDEACEWLLGGGHTRQEEHDLESGLDPDSVIYKSIMSNPIVQLGISNPKSLLAFLMILENPSSTQQWLSDPDTGPMLIQISRMYHAERNIVQPS